MVRKFIVLISSLVAFLLSSHSVASKASPEASFEASFEERVRNIQQVLKSDDFSSHNAEQQLETNSQIAQSWNDWDNSWNDWNNNWNDWNNNWNDWDNWSNY